MPVHRQCRLNIIIKAFCVVLVSQSSLVNQPKNSALHTTNIQDAMKAFLLPFKGPAARKVVAESLIA